MTRRGTALLELLIFGRQSILSIRDLMTLATEGNVGG
jgi:hypothetical protein